MRGLCKLPFVEAVAVTGSLAWGCLPDVEEPCSLVLIAEGGRVASAQGSAALYCKARGARGAELQVLRVLDADSLDFPEPGLDVGLAVAALRPVTNPEAWARRTPGSLSSTPTGIPGRRSFPTTAWPIGWTVGWPRCARA